MKFTIATSILTSSVTTASGSLRNNADDTPSTIRRELADSLKKQSDISATLKERRASKNENGKVIRNLKNKLEESSRLRNLAEADEVDSSESNEKNNIDNMDFGVLSRDLQNENITEVDQANTVMDDLYALCTSNQTDPSFLCECANLDVEAYTASVSCAYVEKCLTPTMNSCGDNVSFCFVETYNLDVTAAGSGASSICYNVSTPMTFDYCYGLTYTGDTDAPTGCFLQIDGTQCDLCELTVSESNSSITCNNFDCNNVDKDISVGKICKDETIVSLKIESYLTYGALPCGGGCNICPGGGEMTSLDSNVTMITGDTYYCYQLNLAAQLGYLQDIPGDLCNSLPALVNEPCGCIGGTGNAAPVAAPSGETTETPASTGGGATETPVASPVSSPADVPAAASPTESSAASNGFAVATTVATTLGWLMV